MQQPKLILITGASSGFGKSAAELLAKEGHRLILLARRQDRLQTLAQTLKSAVHTATVDITQRQQVTHFYASLPKEFQAIDVLINNAGLALGMEPAQTANIDNWDRMVDTNVKGLLYMTHGVLPTMIERKSGHIINVGSVAASAPYRGGNVYGATKAFVRQFSRNLRTDTFGTGIRITNIEPGMAETEFSLVRFGDQVKADAVYKDTRPLTADDIANAIAWAISQPDRVTIDNIEIMPTDQTYAGLVIKRDSN